MTGMERATDLISAWLPFVTVAGLAYRAYRGAKKNVTEWANTLMDNHAAHAQASLDRIEQAQEKQLSLAEKSNELLTVIAGK